MAPLTHAFALLNSHGLLLGAAAGAAALAQRRAALRLSHSVDYQWAVMRTDGEALADVACLAARGALRPHVAAVLPLADAAQAQALVETGSAGGKVVLSIGHDDVATAGGADAKVAGG